MCENVFKSRKELTHSTCREIVKTVHHSLFTLSLLIYSINYRNKVEILLGIQFDSYYFKGSIVTSL